jgi:formylglycine-generating enzyme required for sulfatase activity
VIEKALAKDRNDRFHSATDMARALRAIGQPEADATKHEATLLQTAEAAPAPTKVAPTATKPPAKQEQKGGLPLWVVGAAAVVLIVVLAAGAFLIFSSGEDSPAEEAGGMGTSVASSGPQGLPAAENMTRIPAASYTVGTENSGETYAPIQQLELDEFWIDQYEVTNAEYAEFVAATGQEPPGDWPEGNFPANDANHPVDGVTWDSAAAYCRWVNKRLPEEAEWEVTARGTEGRLFPWGNNQSVVPLPQSGTYEVGSKPTNQSPFGVFDMAGNVWEWVDDPYAPVEQGNEVLRGGANGFLQNMVYRLQGDPGVATMNATAGFRCAADEVDMIQAASLNEDVLFSDDFGDPGSGWPILTEGAFLYGYHPPAFYHVQVSTTDDHTVASREPALTDFTVETNVQVFSAGTGNGNFRYGLAVRRAGDDQYYAFIISPRAGTWAVVKSAPEGLGILTEGTTDSLRGIAPQGFSPDSDQLDSLRVDAQGERFIFRINDEPVAQITDPDYDSGETP